MFVCVCVDRTIDVYNYEALKAKAKACSIFLFICSSALSCRFLVGRLNQWNWEYLLVSQENLRAGCLRL